MDTVDEDYSYENVGYILLNIQDYRCRGGGECIGYLRPHSEIFGIYSSNGI
jgi:hypothetical protein